LPNFQPGKVSRDQSLPFQPAQDAVRAPMGIMHLADMAASCVAKTDIPATGRGTPADMATRHERKTGMRILRPDNVPRHAVVRPVVTTSE
jgi:hypothetical protein